MSVYAPGRDDVPTFNGATTPAQKKAASSYQPRRGTGGVFAQFLQGATPKYATNNGFRSDTQHRNTLARMFVRLDPSERQLFFQSIGDSHTRSQLAPRLAGVVTNTTQRRGRQSAQGGHSSQRQPPDPHTNGYLDFLITNVQHTLQEKVQVSETLADNWVAYYFGQTAPQWSYSGILINSVQDDQASNFFRLYMHILRGTQLARRQKALIVKYDSYTVIGSMTNIQLAYKSDNELLVPFSFTLLVKKILVTNYTSGWLPVAANTPFATDVNAVPFDGRPIEESARTAMTASTPYGTEEVPVTRTEADARTAMPPPDPVEVTTSGENNIPASGITAQEPNASYSNAAANYSSRPETVNASGLTSTNPDVRATRPAPLASGL